MLPLYTNAVALIQVPSVWGYIAIFGLTIAFGTMLLPTKKFDIGDGWFFQWIMSIALAFTLFIVHLCIGSPRIWPLTILSGFLWSTGNITLVPIVKRLGMGIGMLIWNMVSLLIGWASSRFGWFGIRPEMPGNETMNIVGVTLTAMSVSIYVFIAPTSVGQEVAGQNTQDSETTHNTERNVSGSTMDSDPLLYQEMVPVFHRFWRSRTAQRILAVLLSIFSGVLYGTVFVPIIYVQENYRDASHRGIDYVASLGLGAFIGSTTYLLLYALATRWQRSSNGGNERGTPFLLLLLPSWVTGVLCATGQACWLIANEALQASITFPIAATLPGAFSTLLGTLLFREVQGIKNYIKLAVALSFTLAGSILTGLSK
ncbi:transmembrane protein 144 [Echinococcus multilocularis]|uniref:Transmembrane protein 144 n=1 Tax=Echinococcus multilocularis TaxID=6211 RepID=A0A068YJN7_ECHMU|nr:transmembrane protein 144 [Echinococcus multilocularis]